MLTVNYYQFEDLKLDSKIGTCQAYDGMAMPAVPAVPYSGWYLVMGLASLGHTIVHRSRRVLLFIKSIS